MNTKIRLTLMNFLQYAGWGLADLTGAYLGNTLKFDGLQIGSFFATMGIASLFMPAVMGIIADRWIPAQRLWASAISSPQDSSPSPPPELTTTRFTRSSC